MIHSGDLNRSAIATKLREANIAHADRIAALAEWSWRIDTKPVRHELGLGQSRFGGVPDVPADFEWPMRAGAPLAFLAQIDLAQVPTGELPAAGWLLLFYDAVGQPWGFDPLDGDGWRVVYVEPTSTITRRGAPEAAMSFDAHALVIRAAIDLPDRWDDLLEWAGAGITRDEREAYDHVVRQVAGDSDDGDLKLCHHLLGLPQMIQNDMRRECALASQGVNAGNPGAYESARGQPLLAGASEWRLLMQLDSDEDGLGWTWGSNGRLFFWIRRTDLAARAFEKSWVVLQCT